jgi:hypothetical protein
MDRFINLFRLPARPVFLTFSILSILLALVKIVVHLNVVLLPVLLFLAGFVSYWTGARRSLYLFFFLLPLINSLPALFIKGYPFNYICAPLFFLAGILMASIIKRDFSDFKGAWVKPYLWLLVLIWLSVLFVFLRWSNVTLKSLAFLKDTPVEPSGVLFSFATIFPVVTLLLFSLSPLIYFMIRANGLEWIMVMRSILAGYSCSVMIGVFQWRVDPTFLSHDWWGNRMKQYNGGFSDFNGLGLFSGVLFLYLVVFLIDRISANGWQRKFLAEYIFMPVVCLGIFLSGSRTAFVFVLVAGAYFFFTKKIHLKVKIAPALLLALLLFLAGGTLKRRIFVNLKGVGQLKSSRDILDTLNRISNGRITMIGNSWQMVKAFPFCGVGAGNFIFYLKFLHFGEKKYLEDLPLNQYLLLASETGLPGLFLFLVFLVQLLKPPGRHPFGLIMWTMVLMLLVNNFLWLPEAMLLFWIVAALRMRDEGAEKPLPRRGYVSTWAAIVVMAVFLVGNILSFHSLHPLNLTSRHRAPYHYGFWYPEQDNRGSFRWTKGSSGLFLSEEDSRQFVISCQAPLDRISPPGKQEVLIYWRGKQTGRINFKTTGDHRFTLGYRRAGFLEFRIRPTFNLKAMGLGPEGRTLGIQIFHNPSRGDKQ